MNSPATSLASKTCFRIYRRVQGFGVPCRLSRYRPLAFSLPNISQPALGAHSLQIRRAYSTESKSERFEKRLEQNPKNEAIQEGKQSPPLGAAEVQGTPPVHESSEELKNDETVKSEDFLTTIFDNREPYIDTYAVYRQLVDAGFTASQSDEIINLLIFQLNTKLTKLSTKYSQLYELENERYLFESAHQELNVDITRNREQHITEAVNQINALERDYGIISDDLNNHFIQMKNDIQVAINDQRSDNTLMSKKIMLRMQESNHKITTELNMAMRSEMESLRWHLSRWGLITIVVTIFSGSGAFYIYRANTQKKSAQKDEFVPLVIYEPSEFDEDDYHADLDPNAI